MLCVQDGILKKSQNKFLLKNYTRKEFVNVKLFQSKTALTFDIEKLSTITIYIYQMDLGTLLERSQL